MSWFVILLLLSPIVVLMAVSRNQARRSLLRSATIELVVDEFGARREMADGRREEIDWGELREIEVLVAKRGPHGPAGGVVILGGDEQRGCLVPIDRLGEIALVERLQVLPGFDVSSFVEALQGPPGTRVTVWRAATS